MKPRSLRTLAIGMGAVLLGAALLWGAYSLGFSQGAYALEDQSYAKQQTSAAASQIRGECEGLTGPAYAKCSDEIINARDQREHDEQNTSANRKVANRTTEFIILGAVELVLTFCGIVILRDQVIANKRANELTASTFETDSRPIMVPDGIEIDQNFNGHQNIGYRFRWKNIGRLPAIITGGESKMFPREFEGHEPEVWDAEFERGAKLKADKVEIPGDRVIAAGQTYLSWLRMFTLEDSKTDWQLGQAFITYKTALGGKREWRSEVQGTFGPGLEYHRTEDGQAHKRLHGLGFTIRRNGIKMD